MFSLIVSTDRLFGISKYKYIPWNLKEDLRFFRKFTAETYEENAVIMGYNTWATLPKKPLDKRLNIVITRNHAKELSENYKDIEVYSCLEDFLKTRTHGNTHYWVIGGRKIYEWFLENRLVSDIYHTLINGDYKCDNFIPFMKKHILEVPFEEIYKTNVFTITHYHCDNKEEQQILNILREIIDNGNHREERTGTGAVSHFGFRAEFDLSNNTFPLMTTRNHSLKWIFEELMWILRGQTDVSILEKKGINIWSPNSSQDFINKSKLDISLFQGDIGATYGFQMRHYGADYVNCKSKYTSGVDQLSYVVDLLRNNPTSRRIIISLWNPNDLKKATLPPCLLWYQFYVRNGYLDCQFMNRSSDTSVAGGWNVCTASLLVYFLANLTDIKPGRLIWVLGDAHIYKNNVSATKELLKRRPTQFPKLFLNKKLTSLDDIMNLKFEDIKLVGYKPQRPNISFAMNA